MMASRLAQVVFTATQFSEVDSVLFKIDGEVVEVFSGEGIILDGPADPHGLCRYPAADLPR